MAALLLAVLAAPTVASGAEGDPASTSSTTTSTTSSTSTTVADPEPGTGDPEPSEGGPPTSVKLRGLDPAGPLPEDPGEPGETPGAGEPEAPRRPDPSELIPPPLDLGSLDALLDERIAELVAAVQAVIAADVARAQVAVDGARAALAEREAVLATARGALATARDAVSVASAELEDAQGLIGRLAVESYQLAVVGADPSTTGRFAVADDLEDFESLTDLTTYSEAAWGSLDGSVRGARSRHRSAEEAREDAADRLDRAERRVSDARADVAEAEGEVRRIMREGEVAVEEARSAREDFVVEGLGPTILGQTVVSAEDMAAFSEQRPGAAGVDLLPLATLFHEEGADEGVRADIAWVQSILETGNFGYRGSMVAVSDNNYAGIGACDSCSSGFRYGTAREGVRAQMQLLHTYADPELTAADLAHPSVLRPPEKLGVRGCCDTWMELSGVWATGPGYGRKILTIYNELLAFAASRQAAPAPSPGQPAVPAVAGP